MTASLGKLVQLVTDAVDMGERPYVALESVAPAAGQLISDDLPTVALPPAGAATVKPGDVLFGKLRPYLAKTWRVDRVAYASTELMCLRPSDAVDPGWLGYLVTARPLVDWAVATSDGAKMPRTSWERLRQYRVWLPPLGEQRAIADYLDLETARIDALIAAKERMMALINERFWAWLDARVMATQPMLVPLRRLLRRIIDGPFGSSLTSADYVSEGARVVRLGNIGKAEFRNHDQAFIDHDYYLTLFRHTVRPGDLLIAGLGDAHNPVGRACVAPSLGDAIVKADCYCAWVDDRTASAEFLALCLSSPTGAGRVAFAGRGTTRTRINLDIAKSIPVPYCDLSTQAAIVDEASVERSRTQGTSVLLSKQTALLVERRQALITAVVTGRFEVPVPA